MLPSFRSIHPVVLYKKVFLKISQNSQEIPVPESFFNTVIGFQPLTLFKKTSAQVFSLEFCESFKNTYYRTPVNSGFCLSYTR